MECPNLLIGPFSLMLSKFVYFTVTLSKISQNQKSVFFFQDLRDEHDVLSQIETSLLLD